jgi:hypothetical protein
MLVLFVLLLFIAAACHTNHVERTASILASADRLRGDLEFHHDECCCVVSRYRYLDVCKAKKDLWIAGSATLFLPDCSEGMSIYQVSGIVCPFCSFLVSRTRTGQNSACYRRTFVFRHKRTSENDRKTTYHRKVPSKISYVMLRAIVRIHELLL